MDSTQRNSAAPFKELEQIVKPLGMTLAIIKIGFATGIIGSLLGAALYWLVSDMLIQHQPLRVLATHSGMYLFVFVGFIAGVLLAALIYKRNKISVF